MNTLNSISKLFCGGMFTIAFLTIAVPRTQAQTYWTGTNYNFTNPGNGATDVLDAVVWLTRSSASGTGTGGLYNAYLQPDPFTGPTPPGGTEWAIGTLAGYMANTNSLSFGDCPLEAGSHPINYIGTTFVVHLFTNNVYLQLTLTGWGGQGGQGLKTVSYTRSTPALAAPTPTVTITNPLNNAVFAAPATEKIVASATVSSGSVTNVQFFTNNVLLGGITTPPFTLTANNLAAGNYALTATATAAGISATSSVVKISVVTPLTVSLSNVLTFSNTNFEFEYPANVGLSYVVQRATNVFQPTWIPIVTNVAASNPTVFVDIHATSNPAYYRVGRLPNP
ncbi:MAG TPA: Ig-like domain-containing protein [Verrucomicrobiae bacterium]|nr:Ig-like domain-containing protein [Verrucomicrobiae bacterium]